jgi:hypothetical protein
MFTIQISGSVVDIGRYGTRTMQDKKRSSTTNAKRVCLIVYYLHKSYFVVMLSTIARRAAFNSIKPTGTRETS